MNIGIDMTYIPRFKNKVRLAKKILSEKEYETYIALINDKEQFLASRFCLKEAFLKSIKAGLLDINLNEIEVVKEESGAVHIEYLGKIYSASLSHERSYCVGAAISD